MVNGLLDKVRDMNFSGGQIPEDKFGLYLAGRAKYQESAGYNQDCDCIDCGDCDCSDCPV